MTTDLDRLIEAVEAGTWDHDSAAGCASKWLLRKPGRYYGPAYNAFGGSLDAAVSLLEALLPGWHWSLDTGSGMDVPYASVFTAPPSPNIQSHASGDNPARALLLATLRAYRSTREGG